MKKLLTAVFFFSILFLFPSFLTVSPSPPFSPCLFSFIPSPAFVGPHFIHSLLTSYMTLIKRGLRRESNPGHLHPKQVLYHLTTKPYRSYVCLQFSFSFHFRLIISLPFFVQVDNVAEWSKACDQKSLLLWRRRFESCRCRLFSLLILFLSLCIAYLMCPALLFFLTVFCFFVQLTFFIYSFPQKGASPGIEPGPPAPKAGILPLNYKAFCSFPACFSFLICWLASTPSFSPFFH